MHAIHWFEIPVADFERARRFYETIFAIELKPEACGPDSRMAIWPHAGEAVSGCLIEMAQARPHKDGVRIYLNGGDDLGQVLARVEAAGGMIVTPKTLIRPEIGYFALFFDTEGNVIGLHSMH
ncbi:MULTISPECIES: VOC family protein [Uliginosibacterium]|uniref:VOC family protein n=1 Tax=Uliginosibacterium aquaticum TaxID=2731212 RepID=A0ABX2IBA4_9RHOO|nr:MULTISPECIES: VOC family protein [Uliginosibacterium]NSL53447.1 VOC family protein [Uliginosibacterium aquaticum]PLK49429.1 VOC family protein [Uliginosibacterium sp. TH139]